jgi:hypothetical protein
MTGPFGQPAPIQAAPAAQTPTGQTPTGQSPTAPAATAAQTPAAPAPVAPTVLLPAPGRGRRRRAEPSLPFGLDAVVPADRRIEFLLIWAAIAVIAILLGYALGAAGG